MKTRFLGQYLLAKELITAPQLLAAVEYQERRNTRLGEYAVKLGLATSFEVDQIRSLQTQEDRLFGEAAIKLEILTDDQVQQILAAQKDNHVRLGEALSQLGYLGTTELEEALAAFLSEEDRIEPEVVTIPEDLPHQELLFELFYLGHKLLLRAWDMPNKTDRIKIDGDAAALSDRNAIVTLTGSTNLQVVVGVPHSVAEQAARRFTGEEPPSEEAINNIVREFTNVLCGNLRSVLAERGLRINASEAKSIDARLSLPPGKRAALVPFLTHLGQVLIGVLA